jgi:hypothetical protein
MFCHCPTRKKVHIWSLTSNRRKFISAHMYQKEKFDILSLPRREEGNN